MNHAALALRYAARVRRIVTLPDRGRLLVATDLQGNVADFDRVEQLYEQACLEDPDTILIITGDLVHGPEIAESDWPEYLGSFYRGDSTTLLERAEALQRRHPGRVHYLLGNHEHAHVGGPIVSKFFPDEAAHLEQIMGPTRAHEVRAWIRTWPFVAVAPHSGLLMLHAAPHALIRSADDLERLPLDGLSSVPLDEMALHSILGALLWARTTSTQRARSFLNAVHEDAQVAVFGHDVARDGYAIDREPLLCISTSFGCYEGDKLYLDWDLSSRAVSARDAANRGLLPLREGAPTVFRAAPPPG